MDFERLELEKMSRDLGPGAAPDVELDERQKAKVTKVRRRLFRLLRMYDELNFWTFTFYEDVAEEEKSELWNHFMVKLRRAVGEVWYIKVCEEHPSNGRLHFHVIFDRFVDLDKVKAIWELIGAGKVVDLRQKSGGQAACYVAKYLAKAIGQGYSMRAITYSRKFCLHVADWSKWCMKLLGLGDYCYFDALAKYGINFKNVLIRCCSEGGKWKRFWAVLDGLKAVGMSVVYRKLLYGS